MNQTEQIEQIRVMAEYEGWRTYGRPTIGDHIYTKEDQALCLREMDYHTNIASLWPVAKKVCDELTAQVVAARNMQPMSARYMAIVWACTDFDIPALFTATCAGIELLNRYKQNHDTTTK